MLESNIHIKIRGHDFIQALVEVFELGNIEGLKLTWEFFGDPGYPDDPFAFLLETASVERTTGKGVVAKIQLAYFYHTAYTEDEVEYKVAMKYLNEICNALGLSGVFPMIGKYYLDTIGVNHTFDDTGLISDEEVVTLDFRIKKNNEMKAN